MSQGEFRWEFLFYEDFVPSKSGGSGLPARTPLYCTVPSPDEQGPGAFRLFPGLTYRGHCNVRRPWKFIDWRSPMVSLQAQHRSGVKYKQLGK